MTGWDDFAAAANAMPPAERMRAQISLLLASHRTAPAARDAVGLPTGDPDRALVDRVAQAVLAADPPPLERAIALTFRFGGPGWLARERSVPLVRPYIAEAAELAAELDPLAAAWLLTEAARHALLEFHFDLAINRSDAAVDALDRVAPDEEGVFAAAVPDWTAPREAALVSRHSVWFVAARARRRARFDAWEVALKTAMDIANDAEGIRPELFLRTAPDLAAQQRALGTVADLDHWASRAEGNTLIASSLLAQHALNAAHTGARREAAQLYEQRIGVELVRLGVPGSLDDLPGLVAWLRPRPVADRRARFNRLANSAREAAVNLTESGAAASDPAVRRRCEELIDVADAVWDGWANNGPWAALHRRALLRVDDEPDAVLDMLMASRNAAYAGFRVNSAFAAATRASSHRAAVLERIEELLVEQTDPLLSARLHAARAWLTGPGTELDRPTAEADALATTASTGRFGIGSLKSQAYAWWVLARIRRARRDDAEAAQAFREALHLVARLILNATTHETRVFVLAPWRPLLREALDFAERSEAQSVADLVMETVRRDALGPLLTALSNDTAAPAGIAALIRDTRAAMLAAEDAAEARIVADPDPDPDGEPSETTWLSERTTRLAGDLMAALADRLGALGALADPETLYRATPGALVGRLDERRFVLQLLPSTHPALSGGDALLMHRRLSWRDEHGPQEYADAVDLDPQLLVEPGERELRFVAGPDLFPEAFVRAFRLADRAHPLRLLVVPTDLFHLYWDALEIEGVPLLDRVIVSVHTSVTAALQTAQIDESDPPRTGSIGAFDLKIAGMAEQQDVLARHFPLLRGLTPTPSVGEQLRERVAVFALGVHGSDDQGGWGQEKYLPGGVWTAAEALEATYPPVCVLASCHSRVRVAGGIDYAGFPTALFARGAKTVIGSVNRVPTRATLAILERFYPLLQQTGDPVGALRTARLQWIDQQPDRWDEPESWARLVAYGGAAQ